MAFNFQFLETRVRVQPCAFVSASKVYNPDTTEGKEEFLVLFLEGKRNCFVSNRKKVDTDVSHVASG